MPFQFFVVAILPYCKVQTLLTSCQFSYYSCFSSKRGDQSFLTSMINPFSHPCCFLASALQPHLNADGEKVTFQHSSSTSNCKMFRATLSSPHQAFTHQEAQLSCFQISLEKFEMLKWQTNVQHKDAKGRYYAPEGHCTFPFQPWPQLKYYNNDRRAPPIRGFPFLDFSAQFSRVLCNILISCLSTLYSPAMLLMKMALIETENLLSRVSAVLYVRAKQAAPGTEHRKDSIKQKEYSLPTGRVSFPFVDSI